MHFRRIICANLFVIIIYICAMQHRKPKYSKRYAYSCGTAGDESSLVIVINSVAFDPSIESDPCVVLFVAELISTCRACSFNAIYIRPNSTLPYSNLHIVCGNSWFTCRIINSDISKVLVKKMLLDKLILLVINLVFKNSNSGQYDKL